MRIITHLKAYYDWEPCETPVFKEDGTVSVGDKVIPISAIKQNHNGVWLQKITVQRETFNETIISDGQIDSCIEHFKNIGTEKSRKQVVAWYFAEKVMPHHAHPQHFANITVDGEPEIEAYLKMYFELAGE